VLFSNESRFCFTHGDGMQRLWRRRGERFADCCIAQRHHFGINGGNLTRLELVNGNLNGARYGDAILRPVVVPFLQRRGPGAIFQHDNATTHTCHVSRTFLQQQNVNVLDWPANSPDLSPIEHVWDVAVETNPQTCRNSP